MSKNNYDYFLVQGSSMIPTIKPNQKVKIIKTKKDFKIGDIIIFKSNSKNKKNCKIIHRIIKTKNNKIITKGDNRLNCDPPIFYNKILGKVIKVGNKRVDTSYHNFINPIIAKTSYYSMKINPLSYFHYRIIPKFLNNIKFKLIGDKDLHIEKSIIFFLSFPHKINKGILRLLKR